MPALLTKPSSWTPFSIFGNFSFTSFQLHRSIDRISTVGHLAFKSSMFSKETAYLEIANIVNCGPNEWRISGVGAYTLAPNDVSRSVTLRPIPKKNDNIHPLNRILSISYKTVLHAVQTHLYRLQWRGNVFHWNISPMFLPFSTRIHFDCVLVLRLINCPFTVGWTNIYTG